MRHLDTPRFSRLKSSETFLTLQIYKLQRSGILLQMKLMWKQFEIAAVISCSLAEHNKSI